MGIAGWALVLSCVSISIALGSLWWARRGVRNAEFNNAAVFALVDNVATVHELDRGTSFTVRIENTGAGFAHDLEIRWPATSETNLIDNPHRVIVRMGQVEEVRVLCSRATWSQHFENDRDRCVLLTWTAQNRRRGEKLLQLPRSFADYVSAPTHP